jgi:hypothetical protein
MSGDGSQPLQRSSCTTTPTVVAERKEHGPHVTFHQGRSFSTIHFLQTSLTIDECLVSDKFKFDILRYGISTGAIYNKEKREKENQSKRLRFFFFDYASIRFSLSPCLSWLSRVSLSALLSEGRRVYHSSSVFLGIRLRSSLG